MQADITDMNLKTRLHKVWGGQRALEKLLEILNGQHGTTRIVGGAVRNALLGIEIKDIDLATSLPAENVMAILQEHNIRTIPTGLKHGTVTALVDGKSYEITTLRKDVQTHGRHADIVYTDNWLEDAARRDFTVNAFYADFDGTLYDPCGGLKDLSPLRFRFIGDASKRIEEDYLRILRFFRFQSFYGSDDFDAPSLQACLQFAHLIPSLSIERIRDEILKLLQGFRALPILNIMQEHGVLKHVYPATPDIFSVAKLIERERYANLENGLRRLAFLYSEDYEFSAWPDVAAYFKLSNKEKNRFVFKAFMTSETFAAGWPEFAYWYGVEKTIDEYFRLMVFENVSPDASLIRKIQNWMRPEFPVTGVDLMEHGFSTGVALGQSLKQAEKEWAANGFQPMDKAIWIAKITA